MFLPELPFLGEGSVHSCSRSGLSSLILPSLQGLHPPGLGPHSRRWQWRAKLHLPFPWLTGRPEPFPLPRIPSGEKLSSAKPFPGTKKAGGSGSTPNPSLSALLLNIFRIQPDLTVVGLLDAYNSLSPAFWVHLCPAASPASPGPCTLHVAASSMLSAGKSSRITPLQSSPTFEASPRKSRSPHKDL